MSSHVRNSRKRGSAMSDVTTRSEPAVAPASDKPSPDTSSSIRFLKQFAPDGPWILAALKPGGGGPEVKTFKPDTESDALRWIEKHNGRQNLYFQVNPSIRDVSKKASKVDIKSVDWLHVDIDPRKGEYVADEQRRIRELLTGNLPDGVPQPTCIIFSGGGYQAFWRLEEPISINGVEKLWKDAERYNKQLETLFGADSCHNVDRIMRLPGTINIPNAKKRGLGRVEALAELVQFDESQVYSIDQFNRAEASPSRDVVAETAVTAEPRVIEDLSFLDQYFTPDNKGLRDYIKIVVNYGCHPDKPKLNDNSRSAWLFDVCCNLVRCKVPDEVILGILLDPGWRISESVLEHGAKSEDYALRQIKKAGEQVAQDDQPRALVTLDSEIARINEKYFAALTGGKVRFWRENTDGTIEPLDKAAFLFELAPRCYRDQDGTFKQAARVWMVHTRRRYYPRGFVLDSHAEQDGPAYNLWRGFSVEPQPGDWSLMRSHIEEVLAAGDSELATYIINWTAWSFQNPATPPRVALVFRGGQGVGKGMFAGAVTDIFGSHGMRVQNMQHLVGKFNAHLRHLCLLFADEAVVPNSDGEGALKGLITEPTIPIEAKGVDVINADNHLHVIMATNNEWAIPAAADARRFAVFDVSNHRRGDHDYFHALAQQMKEGGLAAMLHDLLERDLGDFRPEDCRPTTDALLTQMDLSLQGAELVVHNLLREGEIPCEFVSEQGRVFVATTLLVNAKRLEERQVRALGEALRAVAGPDAKSVRRYLGEDHSRKQYRGFWLPSLALARQNWETHLGRKVIWPNDVTTWGMETVEVDHSPF